MKHLLLTVCLSAALHAQQPAAAPHTFTSTDGRKLAATILSKTDTSVTLRRAEDGQEFVLPLERLSAADQALVKVWGVKTAAVAAVASGKVVLNIRVIEPKWDAIRAHSDDKKWFFAVKDGAPYVIHADGREVRSQVLKDLKYPRHFGGKYWIVEQDGRQGLYDVEKDSFSIEPVWGRLVRNSNGGPFSKEASLEFAAGVIWACMEKGGSDWSILDFDGNKKAEVPGILGLDDLLVKVQPTVANKRGPGLLFSMLGKELGPWPWENYSDYRDGHVAVATKADYRDSENKWGFADYEGKVVIPPQWDYFPRQPYEKGKATYYITEAFPSGLAAVAVGGHFEAGARWAGGKRGFINKTGELVIPAIWDDTTGFRDGIALVKQGKLWGVISATGEVLAQPQWEEAYLLSKRRVWITKEDKWGLANEKGEVLGEIEWDFSLEQNNGDFSRGSLRVTKDGNEADAVFLSPDGKCFSKAGISLIRGFEHGFALARDTETERVGFVDVEGNWIYRFPDAYQWNKREPAFNEYVRITRDGKAGVILASPKP